jgi:pimeloyl-ACP methyl ester carboxylesterase
MRSLWIVPVNGIEIFLREQGEGPLVILCHGWPGLSYSWRHQIPAIGAAGFHAVAPDMRGFGRSSAPDDTDAYSIFDHVGDMVALVAALGQREAAGMPGSGQCGADWVFQIGNRLMSRAAET